MLDRIREKLLGERFDRQSHILLGAGVGAALAGLLVVSPDPNVQRVIIETAKIPTGLGFLLKTAVENGISPAAVVVGLETTAAILAYKAWQRGLRHR